MYASEPGAGYGLAHLAIGNQLGKATERSAWSWLCTQGHCTDDSTSCVYYARHLVHHSKSEHVASLECDTGQQGKQMDGHSHRDILIHEMTLL